MADFLIHVFIIGFIYVILAAGCNLIVGYGGMIQIGHGAFFAVGAYAGAILSTRTSIPWIAEAVLGMALALAVGMLFAWSLAPLSPDFFGLATMGFAIVTFTILMNWVSLTKGAPGIPGIPGLRLAGLTIRGGVGYLLVAGLLAIACIVLVYLLVRSPFGRGLHAMRDDEVGFVATGRSAARVKVYAYGVGVMLASLAGNLYAHYATYVDPTGFNVEVSFLVLTMVVFGGMGTVAGPVVGALLLIVVPELLRFVGLPQTTGGLIRQALYGFLLVVILFFRPQGLMGGLDWGAATRWLRRSSSQSNTTAPELDRKAQP